MPSAVAFNIGYCWRQRRSSKLTVLGSIIWVFLSPVIYNILLKSQTVPILF